MYVGLLVPAAKITLNGVQFLIIGHASGRVQLIMCCCCVCVCVCPSVHLNVCVMISCEQNISISYKRTLMKFYGAVVRSPGRNLLDFGGSPCFFVDPESFSEILYH